MAVLIGTACGFLLGSFHTMILAISLTRSGSHQTSAFWTIHRLHNSVSVTVLVPLLMMGGWGILGAIVGILFLSANLLAPEGGIGSPNFLFTVVICAFTANTLVLSMLWAKKWFYWEAYSIASIFVMVFGWLMPWMAD